MLFFLNAEDKKQSWIFGCSQQKMTVSTLWDTACPRTLAILLLFRMMNVQRSVFIQLSRCPIHSDLCTLL